MKLNWAERLVVNNPIRVFEQRIHVSWLKGIMPLRQGPVALEVGCGRGAGAKLILRSFQPVWLHAMDLDIRMVQRAKEYLSPREREHVSLYVGDAFRIPFKNRSLDAVFGFGVLHHVPDWRNALAEISRVLKIGGVYFMEELYPAVYQNLVTKHLLAHPRQDRFSSHDLRKALNDVRLPIKDAMEFKKFGILAVAMKEVNNKQ